jgi:glycine/D-amino acid oxidase-like deaminating enzyme/nitrite reductase/ring-hydroxylating ferredoxin subunit
MEAHAGDSKSVWMATERLPAQPALAEDTSADVCIVGAGIAGLSIAYALAKHGKSVVVLDDGPIGGGETERTTAHLVCALDKRYLELERLHGELGAHLAAQSHTAAIDAVEAIVRDEKIDCEFERVDGYLFLPKGEAEGVLRRELEAAQRAGLRGVERVARAPIDSFDTGPALRFPRQAQFHPLKYLRGLASAVRANGGRLYGDTHVAKFNDGTPASVETREGLRVTAGALVVATNSPVNDRVAIHTKQAAYRTYVIAARIPRGSMPNVLLWDTAQEAGMDDATGPTAYHYVRIERSDAPGDADLLIVGGEDHKTGQADDEHERWSRLAGWARDRFPAMGAVEFRWSGQVLEPVDGLAFIGRNPLDGNHVYVATGFSGNGMTYGAIAGALITDLILGRRNAWENLYDPSRKTIGALLGFAKENLNDAAHYAALATAGDVESEEEIASGSGAIVRRGLTKIAVYCDERGACHELSAICPHLGCVVAWNSAEKTWDCPCHGSRFDKLGAVLNGPAISGLHEVEHPESHAAQPAD